ncbi:MAG: M23 family metallopeptidase [Clostridia bacterium]|nr:M23 family metallopeptidase [Clostridia bacterium]
MKYRETSKFPKSIGLTGLYAIIACCLIIIGAIAWFAVAKTKTDTKISENKSGTNKNSSYSSYNKNDDTTPNPFPDTEITGQETQDVPYEDETESEAEGTAPKQTFIMPVKGVVVKDHNDSALQYSATYSDMRLHLGIDIECEKNTQISAVASGTVTDVTDNALLGKTITIDHGNGITAKYCGMGNVEVKSGQTVNTGDALGTIGTVPSECADNTHLHFEVLKDGITVSPLQALGFQ